MDQLTAEQIAHRQIMDDVNKAYGKGTPIEPINIQLKKFTEKLAERGFLFDPREVCKMIDTEAKVQYKDLFDSFFKGHHLDNLTEAKNEVIKWYNEEEERFSKFRDAYLAAPDDFLPKAGAADAPDKIVKINRKKK